MRCRLRLCDRWRCRIRSSRALRRIFRRASSRDLPDRRNTQRPRTKADGDRSSYRQQYENYPNPKVLHGARWYLLVSYYLWEFRCQLLAAEFKANTPPRPPGLRQTKLPKSAVYSLNTMIAWPSTTISPAYPYAISYPKSQRDMKSGLFAG